MNNSENKTPLSGDDIKLIALTSTALEWMSNHSGYFAYTERFNGKVPLKVRIHKDSRKHLAELCNKLYGASEFITTKDGEYFVWVNSYGDVSALLPNGNKLRLSDSDFEVTQWHT